jgi:A/G-specific adenine glycosylase
VDVADTKARIFRRRLLRWWRENGASYPWRAYRDPWSILLTEILLRKTQAQKVSGLVEGVLQVIPSPVAGVHIREADLVELLRPFGMQRIKARDIRALASEIVQRGQVPSSLQELKQLPGVGDYIANAVLCFAFRKRKPLLDVNVIRVFERYFGIASSRSRAHTDQGLWRLAEQLLPRKNFREYNWAIFDLAKLLCRPSKPECEGCPLKATCVFASRLDRSDAQDPAGGAKSRRTVGVSPSPVPMRVNSISVRP